MLEALDRVPWASVSHAYGPATDVPALIRALVKPGEKREQALDTLYGNVIHQGTIWEATPLAAPFFVELCASAQVEDRHELFPYLRALALGAGGFDIEAATRAAMRADFRALLRAIDDGDRRVRIAAIDFFRAFPEDRALIAPELVRRIGTEADVNVTGIALLALGVMASDRVTGAASGDPAGRVRVPEDAIEAIRGTAVDTLARRLRDERPLVRFCAAAALFDVEREATRAEAVSIVRDAIVESEPLHDGWREIGHEGVIGYAAAMLTALGKPAVARLAPELSNALAKLDALTSMDVFAMLLWAMLPEAQETARPMLREEVSPEALEMLRAAVAADPVWMFNANTSSILRPYGLPSWRDELRTWLR